MIDSLKTKIGLVDQARLDRDALTRKLSIEIEPARDSAQQDAAAAKQKLGAVLGAVALGEATEEDLTAARTEFTTAEEKSTGFSGAVTTLHARIAAASDLYRARRLECDQAAAVVAEPLAEALRQRLAALCADVAVTLREFARVEERTRAGRPHAGGMLSGVALLNAAGKLGDVLYEAGINNGDKLHLWPEPAPLCAEDVLQLASF